MIKHGEVNPLNVFGLRKVDHCPPHFERVFFDLYVHEKFLTDWIYENLAGRFYIGQIACRDQFDASKPTVIRTIAAFEIASEASYFSMFLPQLNVSAWAL
jgi:hypothetical protein